MRVALLVIDVQKDFCKGGVLAAKNTETLVGPLNKLISEAMAAGIPVIFTRDWHPAEHGSFVSMGGPWPPHCVQGTDGAQFASGLIVPAGARILDKGVAPYDDGYSMFVGTLLAEWLERLKVGAVAVCGIATEYCVLESVKDAVRNRLKVFLLGDLVRPIDRQPGDSDKAIAEMEQLGAESSNSEDFVAQLKAG